ncbi:MAG TPA: hypothetical protein VFF39_06425, partial [Verrucomicrobiae bacterium]|nr:hypothetical protein [Verrucomicrobiae bacterium]
ETPIFFAFGKEGQGFGQGTWLGLGGRSTPRFEVALVYEQKVDVAAERERLTKELNKLEGELANANRQLGNEQFLAKAPGHVVEGIRKRQGELHTLIEKVKTALAKLG